MKQRLCALLLALGLLCSLPGVALAAGGFSDVPETHWAYGYIQRASGEDWVHGMGDGRYAPSEYLTGAQFLTMVINAFFPGTMEANGSPWYAPCWAAAQANGLQAGTTMTQMSDLTGQINRYDMAQIIANTVSGRGVSVPEIQAVIQDWSSVPQGYRSAVTAAYALGILNGKDGGRFAGEDAMTRAEAAAVLCRMADAVAGSQGGGTTTTPSTPDKPTQPKPEEKPGTSVQTEEEMAAEVVRLVNEERAKEGLSPLGTFDTLTQAAQIRAGEIRTLFSHDRPDGSSCFTALDETGAKDGAFTCGENIAAGYRTAAEVVEGWMNSPGHRANILDADFTHIGVGCSGSSWVQMFVGMRQGSGGGSSQTPGTGTGTGSGTGTGTGTETPGTGTGTNPGSGTETPSAPTPEELTAEVVRLVNVERAKEGLAPLGTFDSLTQAAQIRAPEIVTLFSHDRPDGSSCFTAMDETGAKDGAYTWGENIAAGNATAADTVEQWMNSPGHRANILNENYTHIGVGYAYSNDGYRHYWVQMFVGKR